MIRACVVVGYILFLSACSLKKTDSKPNFIIIFTDDQGYQDLGCFGSPDIRTPNIDRMASEGMKFTSFYAQTVCGPSRAALMTGSYPMRNARNDNGEAPHPKLSLSEVTIAEVLKPVGYATGMIGKWDLAGHNPEKFNPDLLPAHQGFDDSFLTPTSNDSRVHLIRNKELVALNTDMSTLTRRYTDEAIDFIDKHQEQPFFLYLAHTMPHTKLAVSDEFKGKSAGGFYGDVIEEIDFNVGRLLDKVKELGLDENTYVIFTSDNGPWWIKGDHAGHAAPLRGAKTSAWEGGFRVPFIIRAPGNVPAGTTSDQVTATIDLLPTIAEIAGAKLPSDRVIDGLDISDIMHGNTKTLDRPYFYYAHQELRAVRKGKWKLHLPHHPSSGLINYTKWPVHIAPEDRVLFTKHVLYDLENDIGETTDVSAQNPEIVEELNQLLDWAKKDIGDYEKRGENARPLGNEPYFTPNDLIPSK
ncbi:N-acetylgalactosamine-6-sulfatase [Echinicola strongylocentroti]|uniref:N-acetylgalactosamine-6-sulfatase n=1 Tax=Echinicola strongylocentroti TaxID=1795355 RepID=A0A2Z4IPN5_9BACT|nr:sulfatase [Echinicola strongylocentroti]AWW32730.1 N-acetylgalactosamine-6-sulfatase [Echinicola strongylocentroti]